MLDKTNLPISIVIFGIAGDLAKRKLIPALWHLFISGNLPEKFSIVGFARRDWSNDDLKKYVADILKEKNDELFSEKINEFANNFSYASGDFNKEESYRALAERLLEIDRKTKSCRAKLFHLSVPPEMYETIFEQMSKGGLSGICANSGGWTRILVEKPFGNDWYTAENLDQKMGSLFKEDQIFRVDHYMGKESVQNILAFRFSNSFLEHLWSNKFIEKINIRLWEKIGIEGRGAFYDQIGALRDVGQNHILQMLAFIAMEDPIIFEAEAIRKSRAKVLSELKIISKEEISRFASRGQYEGYLDELSVKPNSKTETYFRVEARVENERWAGVPFYLESGKGLGKSEVEIEIVFRKKDSCLCPLDANEDVSKNKIIFRIQPNEGIDLYFWAKRPGFEMKLDPKMLSFSYEKNEKDKKPPDAYERVIFDCIMGDQTLFASTEEVLASWKFITPIIENWKDLPILKYKKGWIPEN
ncbi:MAG: glucose-6-phosphate dehydrogenase [Patescibacteria group bacterium]